MMDGGYESSVAGVTRPLCIADFASTNTDRPAVGPVTLAQLAEHEPTTLFESPVWLKVYGFAKLVALHLKGRAQYPLLFAARDRHLVHLGRLRWFEADCIEYLTGVLLEQPGVDFVVFEDVQVEGAPSARFRGSTFHYQRNWRVVLNGPEAGQYPKSKSSRVALRKAQRAMERDIEGVHVEFVERPSPDLVKTIVDFNRAKVESRNKRHAIDEQELGRLGAVASEIGHAVTINDGSRVIAGLIVCVTGGRAYGMVVGYDMKLSRYGLGIMAYDLAIENCRQRGMRDLNMLWGDGVYKRRLGGKPQELSTLVARRSPTVRLSSAYIRAVRPYHWFAFKVRAKRFIRHQPAE